MPLKTLVKVGTITNLSDARYCAGMGVDMLGFRVIEGTDHHIEVPLYQQIRGWVSGPKVVGEMYGLKKAEDIQSVMVNYVPDLIEMTYEEYEAFGSAISIPIIVSLSAAEIIHVDDAHSQVQYWLIDAENLPVLRGHTPTKQILVKVRAKADIGEITTTAFVTGVALNGSPEIRPGYKNYDDLADVLESLDVD